eukprot:CAMPEP_0170345806 /NCGR_PEP_ID=MMETSP0116_2-20130129/74140_1 /TAXON_ID=400756 /ORGANISM="Durinskia baltica, Strain CSIRO CS-38" /LENGTH=520 /DNA_ID=CAMNT_0010599583 /DNA_START=95 /DNA_END=1654 /DNA_ORIENTATION=-
MLAALFHARGGFACELDDGVLDPLAARPHVLHRQPLDALLRIACLAAHEVLASILVAQAGATVGDVLAALGLALLPGLQALLVHDESGHRRLRPAAGRDEGAERRDEHSRHTVQLLRAIEDALEDLVDGGMVGDVNSSTSWRGSLDRIGNAVREAVGEEAGLDHPALPGADGVEAASGEEPHGLPRLAGNRHVAELQRLARGGVPEFCHRINPELLADGLRDGAPEVGQVLGKEEVHQVHFPRIVLDHGPVDPHLASVQHDPQFLHRLRVRVFQPVLQLLDEEGRTVEEPLHGEAHKRRHEVRAPEDRASDVPEGAAEQGLEGVPHVLGHVLLDAPLPELMDERRGAPGRHQPGHHEEPVAPHPLADSHARGAHHGREGTGLRPHLPAEGPYPRREDDGRLADPVNVRLQALVEVFQPAEEDDGIFAAIQGLHIPPAIDVLVLYDFPMVSEELEGIHKRHGLRADGGDVLHDHREVVEGPRDVARELLHLLQEAARGLGLGLQGLRTEGGLVDAAVAVQL